MEGPKSREIPDAIQPSDQLGREARSQTEARKALRKQKRGMVGHARMTVFRPPDNASEISVNRMGFASDAEMAEIGIRNAAADRGRLFWGWYILSAGDIGAAGCSVEPSPTRDNPYHADIVMPVALGAEDRRDALTEYAKDLSDCAIFRPWGSWVDGVG